MQLYRTLHLCCRNARTVNRQRGSFARFRLTGMGRSRLLFISCLAPDRRGRLSRRLRRIIGPTGKVFFDCKRSGGVSQIRFLETPSPSIFPPTLEHDSLRWEVWPWRREDKGENELSAGQGSTDDVAVQLFRPEVGRNVIDPHEVDLLTYALAHTVHSILHAL